MGWSITTHKDLLLPRQQTPQLFSGAITESAETAGKTTNDKRITQLGIEGNDH
jgi:hypothetical protein